MTWRQDLSQPIVSVNLSDSHVVRTHGGLCDDVIMIAIVMVWLSVVLCGSGFSSIGLVSVWFWIKTVVSVSNSKPSQHCF